MLKIKKKKSLEVYLKSWNSLFLKSITIFKEEGRAMRMIQAYILDNNRINYNNTRLPNIKTNKKTLFKRNFPPIYFFLLVKKYTRAPELKVSYANII